MPPFTTQRRILVGLIGGNIMKSLSPALHEDAFEAAGWRGHYHLMDLERLQGRSLHQLFEAVKAAGFDGINVTFPCKQSIMPLLDEVSDDARQIGAVNTVTIDIGGRSKGYNTDRSGFLCAFEQGLGRGRIEGKSAVLIGAGGAGRAVGFALADLGASTIIVHDNDGTRASALAADLDQLGSREARVACSLDEEIAAASGVVNATPIGMLGVPGNPVPCAPLNPHHWVADVIYTPTETAFVKAAREAGAAVLTGGGMCVHQAADAFRLFTGITPDVARMHRTFARALAARDAALSSVA